MPTAARDRLARTLRGDAQAAFSVELTARLDDLSLEVEGFGPVKFPVTPAKARKLPRSRPARPVRPGRGDADRPGRPRHVGDPQAPRPRRVGQRRAEGRPRRGEREAGPAARCRTDSRPEGGGGSSARRCGQRTPWRTHRPRRCCSGRFASRIWTTSPWTRSGKSPAGFGQPWTTELVLTWFGRDRQAWTYGGQERPRWIADQLPGLCARLHASGKTGAVAAQQLVDLAWEWTAKDIGTGLASSPSRRDEKLRDLARPLASVLTAAAAIGAASTRDAVSGYVREQGNAVTALEMPALRAAAELSLGGARGVARLR